MILYLQNVWTVMQAFAPWLLLGLFFAGMLHVFMPPGFIRRHLGNGRISGVLKAAFLGVPIPLCSCGVIPTAVGLKKEGASDGACVSFLISTPQTGVDSIAVSASMLGFPFAIFKVLTSFITGVIGGLVTGFVKHDPLPDIQASSSEKSGKPKRLKEMWEFAVEGLFYDLWKWIALGILVSAAISTFIPEDRLAYSPWAQGITGMFFMLLVSVPLYVCTTGSVPIAASLVQAGMPVGAALVFLTAGPATNAATIGAVLKTFGKRVTAIYLGVIVAGGIGFGVVYEKFFGDLEVNALCAACTEQMPMFTLISTLVLAGFLVYFAGKDIVRVVRRFRNVSGEASTTVVLAVGGMTCKSCARKVASVLEKIDAVRSVEIDLESKRVTVSGKDPDTDMLCRMLEDVGFEAELKEKKNCCQA